MFHVRIAVASLVPRPHSLGNEARLWPAEDMSACKMGREHTTTVDACSMPFLQSLIACCM